MSAADASGAACEAAHIKLLLDEWDPGEDYEDYLSDHQSEWGSFDDLDLPANCIASYFGVGVDDVLSHMEMCFQVDAQIRQEDETERRQLSGGSYV